MLNIINGLPSHVLGIRASGEVSAADMQIVLSPALDSLADQTGGIHYLLVLDTGVQNFTSGAWWQDMIAGLKHFNQWQRIAVVTDQTPVAMFTDLFELAVPGRSKGFSPDELRDAITWVSEPAAISLPGQLARLALGSILVFAGISHLTFARKAFRAQVPDWVPLKKDDTVFYSGLAEIALGSALILAPKRHQKLTGKAAAVFFTGVFPGNIAQFTGRRNAFGLDTDGKRLARLFFQPLLILWALKSTHKK